MSKFKSQSDAAQGRFKVGDRVVTYEPGIIGEEYAGIVGLVTKVLSDDSVCILYPDGITQWCIPEEDKLQYAPEMESPDVDTFDAVSKPSHYNHSGGIECIDYIRQVLGKEGFIAYCRGNQIKYQHRAMYKGKPVEDLEKAHQYNAWAIEALKETEE